MQHAVDRAVALEGKPVVEVDRGRAAALLHARALALAGDEGEVVPQVVHVSALGADAPARDAIVLALDAIVRELQPLAASFFRVGDDGEIASSVVHASHLPPAQVARQVRAWKATLGACDPLAPSRLRMPPGRIATVRGDDAATPSPLDPRVEEAYRHLGVANDARLLIRDGGRVVAGVTLWRSWSARPWSSAQLRLLRTVQPLVEMAYLSQLAEAADVDRELPPALTRRERQVARLLARGVTNAELAHALHVSPNTAKTHTRAVLRKLGATSRRALVARFAPARTSSTELLRPALHEPGDPARWIEGAATRQRLLLAPVLGWGAVRLDAALGGFATLFARGSLAADVCGTARPGADRLDHPLVHELRRALLAPRLLARLAADPAPPLAAPADALLPPDERARVGGLVARLGLAMPLVSVLRPLGRVAGVVWIAPDARLAGDPHAAVRELRALHPLLELAYARQLEGAVTRAEAAAGLAALPLTERQLEVARLALEGAGNDDICRALHLSQSTVKNHMTRLFAACGVRSRTELIAAFGPAASARALAPHREPAGAQQSSSQSAPSSGVATQQPSPRQASRPSLTATAAISRPTAGSSHQAPASALPSRPISRAPAR